MESHALPPIVQSSFINARPTRIWETLTTAEGWDAWFTQGTTMDCRAGGFVRFRWEGFAGRTAVVEDGGPILEVVPGALLVFQWSPTDHPTTVRIEIRPQGGGAFVVVSETGYERTERDLGAFVNCAAGWGEAITLLKFFLEHGLTYGAVPAAS
jgi:uncharacterized protein YndB with AHSA1/START domain